MFDLLIWLIVAPALIVTLLSLLHPTTKQAISLQKTSNLYREVVLIDQSITRDLMRGNEIEVSDVLTINGVIYYTEGDRLIRLYNGKKYTLGKGAFGAEITNQQLKIHYNDSELTYCIFWSDYNE